MTDRSSRSATALLLVTSVLAACGESTPRARGLPPTAPGLCEPVPPSDWRLDGPCTVSVQDPTRLVVTTTDFSTGAVSVVDLSTHTVTADVALASTDAIPFSHRGDVLIVNRYGYDYIDRLDAAHGFALMGEYPAMVDGFVSTNPQSVAFRQDGIAMVPLFGEPYVFLYDFTLVAGDALVGSVDLSRFADDDGNPELALAFACGSTVFVAAQRLDPWFLPADTEILVPIDGPSCAAHDEPIELLGHYARQVRADPSSPDGLTVLVLTTGVERVDLASRSVSWAVDEALLDAAGIGGEYQPLAFAIHRDQTIYLAAFNAAFTSVDIWRVSLSGAQQLERVLTGFMAAEKTLEVVGDDLWLGDTMGGAEGMRVFHLATEPPTAVAGPLDVGLPPYSVVAIP